MVLQALGSQVVFYHKVHHLLDLALFELANYKLKQKGHIDVRDCLGVAEPGSGGQFLLQFFVQSF